MNLSGPFLFSPWEGSTASHNLHPTVLEIPPPEGDSFGEHPPPRPSVSLSDSTRLRLRDSLSPRSSLGLPGSGPCYPADRGGHSHVLAHLLRLHWISP